MKNTLALIFGTLLGLHAYGSSANAALVDAPVDPSEFITIGGADWAWAGPCAPFEPSCGVIDLSFQAPLGWALASTLQIDAVILAVGGLTSWVDLFQVDDICASRFFSNSFSHCDYSDGDLGGIYNYSGNTFGEHPALEVFAVRVSTVPVPAALPLFLSGLGLLGFVRKLRRRA